MLTYISCTGWSCIILDQLSLPNFQYSLIDCSYFGYYSLGVVKFVIHITLGKLLHNPLTLTWIFHPAWLQVCGGVCARVYVWCVYVRTPAFSWL